MSSKPGNTLEEFLAWNYRLIVEGLGETNISLGMAEAIGTVQPRPFVEEKDFQRLVAVFEPYREGMERVLEDYDEEENGSWRDFAIFVAERAPLSAWEAGGIIVKALRTLAPTHPLHPEPKP